MRRRILFSALAVLVLPACAELRTPRPRIALPLDLVPGSEDPVRSAARLAAAAFASEGAAVQNNPAGMARAAARLEYLVQILASDPRFRVLPPGLLLSLRGAVGEVRLALGIAPLALPEQLVPVLAQLARVIDAGGDTRPAFPAAFFPAGPERSLQRLTQPGPLPEAAMATGRLLDQITDLDQTEGWNGPPDTRPDTRMVR
ncbi:hypothetical protein NON00_03220 [Roseomonas sp. GC11]|uniref:hypothetical protein n=1 Tax=Roseomonas sp. GC11 TaxID=2950546 RepID=UPI00210EDD46|nr:hypothetical protein [Roseomonas sp. GC11]MCQ4158934.1 hypothetical protein [Roseomonas sp. GC11]